MSLQTHTQDRPTQKRLVSWRLLPLVVLAAGAGLFFGLGAHHVLTFQALHDNRTELLSWVAAHQGAAALAYAAVYAVTVVFLPPSGTVLTVMGGFVFGAALATVYTVVGATVGATLLFLIARMSVGDALRERAGPGIRRMEAGFRENAMSYLLVLRLVPLFPFWLVNIAPAFLGVSLRTYVIGTFVGIIPGTAIYAIFGAGLGSVLDSAEPMSLSGVLTPEVVAGLVGLALLALVPVVYKRMKDRTA